ncbi:MAG: CinA family nicotinamide mononucleotide deamidase-related protein [Spirochaetaceae bacterium]|nr:MAG: CinA family nicotinamide mononucleotide deamidase-related protein [Spirochaetaceae bacterium]
MGDQPTSTILSVGTELTEGTILNTHFRFIGAELRGLGFFTRRAVQIPDDPDIFRRELRAAVESSALVIVTGGLGPTSDDLTREVVAEICDAPLYFDEAIWDELVARYSARGRQIAPTNRKQALIPTGFQVLPNRVGTAPGFLGESGECMILALPGPPAELEQMFLLEAIPRIQPHFLGAQETSASVLTATALMIPESVLEQALQGNDAAAKSRVRWSTRVAHDRIVFTLRGGEENDRRRIFSDLVERFGRVRVREGDVVPSNSLYQVLKQRNERIAIAESCTGGLVSKLLTDIPGSSQVFWGSLVTYSNESKTNLLQVPADLLGSAGAVSAEVASAMSEGLLRHTPAEVAVAVTGIAGPEGGSPEKPVGTVWISARYRPVGQLCKRFQFHGGREAVRRRSAVAALLLAECVLLGLEADLEY